MASLISHQPQAPNQVDSQSKLPLPVSVEDGEESPGGNPTEHRRGTAMFLDVDPNIRWAISDTASRFEYNDDDALKLNLSDDKQLAESKAKADTEGNRNAIIEEVLGHWRQKESVQNKRFPPEERVAEAKSIVEKHYPEILDYCVRTAIKTKQERQKEPDPINKAHQDRQAVNRVLRQHHNNATLYGILGLADHASNAKIKEAHKRLVLALHPDRNKDQEATECISLVNNAKDILLSTEGRAKYDEFIRKNPGSTSDVGDFGEDFDPSAFEDDDEDDDMIESDDESGDDEDTPERSGTVQNCHTKIGEQIMKGFQTVDEPLDGEITKVIDNFNKVIEKNNKTKRKGSPKRNPDAYKFPSTEAIRFKHWQGKILFYRKHGIFTSAQSKQDAEVLQRVFQKTAQKKSRQWPTEWSDYMLNPLQASLDELGEGTTEEIKFHGNQAVNNRAFLPQPNLAVDQQPKQLAVRQLATPGYTNTGRPIIGYQRIDRKSPMTGEVIDSNYDFFVDIGGDNPLFKATIREVGFPAARLYHELPEDKKNDIKKGKENLAELQPGKFLGIYCANGRSSGGFPPTWIWLKVLNEPNKTAILTRTELRDVLGSETDSEIEQFFINKSLKPAWANPSPPKIRPQLMFPPPGPFMRPHYSSNQLSLSRTPGVQNDNQSTEANLISVLAQLVEQLQKLST